MQPSRKPTLLLHFPPTKARYSLQSIFQQVTGLLVLRCFLPLAKAALGAVPHHCWEHDMLMTHFRAEILFPNRKKQSHPWPYLSHLISLKAAINYQALETTRKMWIIFPSPPQIHHRNSMHAPWHVGAWKPSEHIAAITALQTLGEALGVFRKVFWGCLTGKICIQQRSNCIPCLARPWHVHGSLAQLQNHSTQLHPPTLTLPLNYPSWAMTPSQA